MKLLVLGLCALTATCASTARSRAADDLASPPGIEPCDAVCELQRYLNTDHMVRLVPAPDRPVLPASKRVLVRTKSLKPLPATAHVDHRAHPGTEAVLPLPPSRDIPSVPVRSAELTTPSAMPEAPGAPPLSQPVMPPTPAVIPGSMPIVPPHFVQP